MSSHRKFSMRSRAKARLGLPSEEEQQGGRYTRLAGSSSEHGAWTTANLELQQNLITLDIGFREIVGTLYSHAIFSPATSSPW